MHYQQRNDMITINDLIGNGYVLLLGGSLILYAIDIIYFLEKIRQKISNQEQAILTNFQQKYGNACIKFNDVVDIFKTMRKSEEDLLDPENSIKQSKWSGISIIIGCVIGIFASFTEGIIPQYIPLMILFISGGIFVFSFVVLLKWYKI